MTPNQARGHEIMVNLDGRRRTARELLAYDGVSVARLAAIWPELGEVQADVAEQLEIDARYHAYLDRQAADIAAFRKDEALAIPADIDYDAVGSLSNEVREKLRRHGPATLGAAARIPGVTAAALTALLGHVRRADRRRVA